MNPRVIRLTLLALGCGLLINGLYLFTARSIIDNQKTYANAQLLAVAGLSNVTLTERQPGSYVITEDSEALGYISSVTTRKGYNGTIKFWLAVDTTGNILGVRIYQHTETPGLGDKIELEVSDWVLDFNGHSLANTPPGAWQVKSEGGLFDQFSGATITPRAIILAVRQQLEILQQQALNPGNTSLE
ncbi:MAG: RnfABCDGE-type electron transport complex G subunit [Candidatus Pseudothioglobus sp.]|jgi:RnfABCDGE-type electron transport complex G subunit